MNFRAMLVFALAMLTPFAAHAVTASSTNYSSATVGTASKEVVAAYKANAFLDIMNDSTTATVACAFGTTPSLNGAGSITLQPGWHRSWEGNYVPTDAVNCVASASSTPMTIGVK